MLKPEFCDDQFTISKKPPSENYMMKSDLLEKLVKPKSFINPLIMLVCQSLELYF
jgi:hypothetical protein